MNNKKQKKEKKVNTEQVLSWVGSEVSNEDFAEILAEIANGDYKPSLLRDEILDYDENQDG